MTIQSNVTLIFLGFLATACGYGDDVGGQLGGNCYNHLSKACRAEEVNISGSNTTFTSIVSYPRVVYGREVGNSCPDTNPDE